MQIAGKTGARGLVHAFYRVDYERGGGGQSFLELPRRKNL